MLKGSSSSRSTRAFGHDNDEQAGHTELRLRGGGRDDDLDDDAVASFLPGGFGASSLEANIERQLENARRKVVPAVGDKAKRKPDSDTDSDEDDEDDEEDEDEFPVSHRLVLKTHERAVTSLTIDPAGTRMITGSTDCTMKLHDFGSMTLTTMRAFKSVDPTLTKTSANSESHPVHHVEFNPISPGQVLVVSATSKAKIFSRDGEEVVEFVKGDMYLRDMHNTKGHISEITTAAWHPSNRNLCVTAGTDSTLRIWDVNLKRSQKEVIVHKSRAAGSGGRTRMTAVAWGSDVQGGPDMLVSAALDGSLVLWSGQGPYSRPAAEVREAHKNGTWTSGLAISKDGRNVVTRGGDDTIKLWDTRKFKTPVTVVSHPSSSSQHPTSNIIYSPTGSSILTGSPNGDLHILNPATLRPELVTAVTPGSTLITVSWHEKMNQIITGSANAEVHLLFSPNTSSKGAAAIVSRAPKRRHIDDDPSLTTDISEGVSGDSVMNPDGVLTAPTQGGPRNPTIGLTVSGKSRDPRRPHIPVTTPFAKSQPDEAHIKNNIPLSSMRDEDPREALLKYAEKAEKDPMFTYAWKQTQPKTIYAELSEDEEEPDKKKTKR